MEISKMSERQLRSALAFLGGYIENEKKSKGDTELVKLFESAIKYAMEEE